MSNVRREFFTWTLAIICVIVALSIAPLPIGLTATALVASLWCRKIDSEEYAVQLVAPEPADENR